MVGSPQTSSFMQQHTGKLVGVCVLGPPVSLQSSSSIQPTELRVKPSDLIILSANPSSRGKTVSTAYSLKESPDLVLEGFI